jgi:hypothetical protein
MSNLTKRQKGRGIKPIYNLQLKNDCQWLTGQ